MKNLNQIKLVVFDVNQTLFHLRELEKRFKQIGLKKYHCELWFNNVLKEGFSLGCLGIFKPFKSIGLDQLKSILVKEKKPSKSSQYILEGFSELKAHKNIKESFKLLKKKKIKIATLTNGHSGITKILLKKNGLSKYVDHCFSVDDVKKWKPFPEAYQQVLHHYKIKPNKAIMIASHAWDIAGAMNAGLNSGYIENYEGRFKSYYKKPDISGETVLEVIKKIIISI